MNKIGGKEIIPGVSVIECTDQQSCMFGYSGTVGRERGDRYDVRWPGGCVGMLHPAQFKVIGERRIYEDAVPRRFNVEGFPSA